MNTQQYSFSCVNKPQSFIDLSRSCETHPLATTINVSRPFPKTHPLTTTIHEFRPSRNTHPLATTIHGSQLSIHGSQPFLTHQLVSTIHGSRPSVHRSLHSLATTIHGSRQSMKNLSVGTPTLISTTGNNNWLTINESLPFVGNQNLVNS